jgi:hypothetical protein
VGGAPDAGSLMRARQAHSVVLLSGGGLRRSKESTMRSYTLPRAACAAATTLCLCSTQRPTVSRFVTAGGEEALERLQLVAYCSGQCGSIHILVAYRIAAQGCH